MTLTAEPTTTHKDGRVVAIAGPFVDVEFPPDDLPESTPRSSSTSSSRARHQGHREVAQQIGDSRSASSA